MCILFVQAGVNVHACLCVSVSVANSGCESILGRPVCQASQIGSDSSPVVHRAPLAYRQTGGAEEGREERRGGWGRVAMTQTQHDSPA